MFGFAEDLGDGRWRVQALENDTPQAARDSLAHRYRVRAAETTYAALAEELAAVVRVLDWEKVDELTIAGRRHRVIRADTFARFGSDGPEPHARAIRTRCLLAAGGTCLGAART